MKKLLPVFVLALMFVSLTAEASCPSVFEPGSYKLFASCQGKAEAADRDVCIYETAKPESFQVAGMLKWSVLTNDIGNSEVFNLVYQDYTIIENHEAAVVIHKATGEALMYESSYGIGHDLEPYEDSYEFSAHCEFK